MAVIPTYPGVYVQEVPSGVRTIVGVGTSTALFIGRTANGPMLRPVRITTYTDFLRTFGDDGGLVSSVARYVRLFFLNGGTDCYVIRIASGAQRAKVTLRPETGPSTALELTAKSPGTLGDWLRVAVNYNTASPESTFNLEAFRWELVGGVKRKVDREEFLNLTMDPSSPSYAPVVITQRSNLIDAHDPNAAATTAVGYSLAMRPIVHASPTDGSLLLAAYNAIVAATDRFRISIEDKQFVDVTLVPIQIVGTPSVAVARDQIRDQIEADINQGVLDQQVSGLPSPVPVEVRVLAGPVGAAPATTTMIRFRAVTAGRNVVVQSANEINRDFARAMMFGVGNGGIEGTAYASRRPAATGVTLRAGAGLGGTLNNGDSLTGVSTPLIHFGNARHNELATVTLDQRDPVSGTLVPAVIDLPLPFGPVVGTPQDPAGLTTNVWVDGAGGPRGILEGLGVIRDAVNAASAADPSGFGWRAELWGHRLAFVNGGGDDNAIVAAPGLAFQGTLGAALTAAFTANVRHYSFGGSGTAGFQINSAAGNSGTAPHASDYTDAYERAHSDIDLFNLLVLPPDANPAAGATLEDLWPEASAFCSSERAFLIMDPPPAWGDPQSASSGVNTLRLGLTKDHSAVYFPRLKILESGIERIVGPAGAVAGVFARIDGTRGVWKAPAGSEADVRGVTGVDVSMSDLQNGQINPVGVNAIRVFPEGVVSWGARTMDGADAFASEYKYVPIRRLALFLEESLYRGLKWAVFEPNDEALWAQIRLNVGAFMQDLYRKGAFAGGKPSEAYFVKCDKETTTANDQNLGIVNIWVGFAPVKPAEFVVLYLQQIAQKLAS